MGRIVSLEATPNQHFKPRRHAMDNSCGGTVVKTFGLGMSLGVNYSDEHKGHAAV